MSQLITQDALRDWTGYKRQSDLEDFCNKYQIKFHRAKGNKLVTTQAAIDQSLLFTDTAQNDNQYEL